MKLVVLGAGYSASAAIGRVKHHAPGAEIVATTRDAGKAETLARTFGLNALVWDGTARDATLVSALESATHLLVSIAPNAEGDPVLAAFGDVLAGNVHLQWIGYYSTVGVYGDAGGAWVDEDAPTSDHSERSLWRRRAEANWRALAERTGKRLAILRLAGIYGPGRSGFDKLRAGTAHRIVRPGQVFNRIHRDDIAEITALAALSRLDGTYNLADDEPAPPQDVTAHAATLIGVPPPPETDFETTPLSPMARSFYASNRRVSNEKIKAALGYRMLYPTYREGLAAILAEERADKRD